jgi:small subunit ribosomal protein S17
MENKQKSEKIKEKNTKKCLDRDCPIHNSLKTRGKSFKGYVTRKFPKRIAIEFERIVPVPKYERYEKKKTRIHARLPDCCFDDVNVGDYVLIKECRPLSKMIHFVYLKKINPEKEK